MARADASAQTGRLLQRPAAESVWRQLATSAATHSSNATTNDRSNANASTSDATSHSAHSNADTTAANAPTPAAAADYDVIICGGGMVGFGLACSLGERRSFINVDLMSVVSSRDVLIPKFQPIPIPEL